MNAHRHMSFDLDGTLVLQDYAAKLGKLHAIAVDSGRGDIALSVLRRAISCANEWYDDVAPKWSQVGESVWREYARIVLGYCGVEAETAVDRFAAYFMEYNSNAKNFVVPDFVLRTIEALVARDTARPALSVISSNLLADQRLSLVGLRGFFRRVLSPALGRSKGALFYELLKLEALKPHELLHIGNDPISDVQLPRMAGIDTFLISSRTDFAERYSLDLRDMTEDLAIGFRALRSTVGLAGL